MIEIVFYKKKLDNKKYFWVDIISEQTKAIIAGEGFENVADAFEFAREYEEDILGSDFSEDVWEYKLEIAKVCYEINDNPQLYEEYKYKIMEIQLTMIESILGKNELEKIIHEDSNDKTDLYLEEVNNELDIK